MTTAVEKLINIAETMREYMAHSHSCSKQITWSCICGMDELLEKFEDAVAAVEGSRK